MSQISNLNSMKTYISNTILRLRRYSKQLDAQSILYGKSWEVFNDIGDKEVFIFRPNSELIISRNGLVQKGKWELLSITSMLIDIDNKSYLLNTAFADDKFLALQLDGNDGCIILIESETNKQLFLDSISRVENYLLNKYIAPEPIVNVHKPEIIVDTDDNTTFRIIGLVFFFIILIIIYVASLVNN